jgi:hypothetical protein
LFDLLCLNLIAIIKYLLSLVSSASFLPEARYVWWLRCPYFLEASLLAVTRITPYTAIKVVGVPIRIGYEKYMLKE